MTPSEKRILVLKGFEDELQKHAGVVSAIWKGTKALFGKGVQKATDPKVQKAVKEKIKHHADDIAVVGTGAAGYGVYKGLSNNKEEKKEKAVTVKKDLSKELNLNNLSKKDSTEKKEIKPPKNIVTQKDTVITPPKNNVDTSKVVKEEKPPKKIINNPFGNTNQSKLDSMINSMYD